MAKKERKAMAEARSRTKAAKTLLKTRREWLSDAQDAFNNYIRARDFDKPCICCGQWPKVQGKYGGDWDAGHFLSVGSHPELRFDPDNCHRQLKECNGGSGRFSKHGRVVSEGYRQGIIERIGIERVERLEGPHEPRKYTIDELQALIKTYRAKKRELERERNHVQ
jgi:hypothetical protein